MLPESLHIIDSCETDEFSLGIKNEHWREDFDSEIVVKGSGLLLKESRKVVIILCELAGGVVHSDGDNFELISSIIDFFEKIWENLAELDTPFTPLGSEENSEELAIEILYVGLLFGLFIEERTEFSKHIENTLRGHVSV